MAEYLTVAEIQAAFGTLDRIADTQREDAERMTLLSMREAEAFRALAKEDADALRARLADVERERDEKRAALENAIDSHPDAWMARALDAERENARRLEVVAELAQALRERDARRVAKGLAQVLATNGFRWYGTIALDVWIDTALAYEVEP